MTARDLAALVADLRAKAEAATPGPWRSCWGDPSGTNEEPLEPGCTNLGEEWLIKAGDETIVGTSYYDGLHVACTEPNAALIAACSPDAILRLLDRVEELERKLKNAGIY